MNVERLLQISIAMLSAVGAIFLSVSQSDPTMAVVMLFVALTSVVFTDHLRWLRVNRPLASLWVLGSMIYAFGMYQSSDGPRKLMAVANLLVYMQVVLLYQEKNHRLYWQLITLSFLEVVISAALSTGSAFGGLLVVYLAIAVVALAAFFVLRETSRTTLARPSRGSVETPGRRRGLRGAPLVAYFDRPAAALADELLRHTFVRPLLAIGLATLAFAVVAFYAMPRLGGALWQGPRMTRTATVGFSSTVSLHEMGNILQSDDPVMRVAFYDLDTEKPYRVLAEPYFRGTVLTRYATEEIPAGTWGAPTISPSRSDLPPQPPTKSEIVRQEIWLEPSSESNLFSVYPAYSLAETSPDVRFDVHHGLLYRSSANSTTGAFHYVLGTGGLTRGSQSALTPFVPRRNQVGLSRYERDELLRFDASRFRQLIQVAERIVRVADISGADRVSLARSLEGHFLSPGAYRYSLNFDQPRDSGLDPIEDFVANHHQGHCEYFASALTMMLRSRDIPARLIVGFHGGEFNTVGDYFLVRQLHAHAWVEAYLRPSDVVALRPDAADLFPHGAWLRLDPTPSAEGPDTAQRVTHSFGPVRGLLDYIEFLWSDYVVGMDAEQQQRSVYKPLTDDLAFTVANFVSAGNFRRMLHAAGLGDQFDVTRWTLDDWFSWPAGCLAAVLSLLLVALFKLVKWLIWSRQAPGRRVVRWLRGWLAGRELAKRSVIEFYARFEQILARRGLRRMAHQTQREFADHVTAADQPAAPRLIGPLAEQIVDAFYGVRFGHATLDKEQTEAIEHALARLNEALSVPPPSHPQSTSP